MTTALGAPLTKVSVARACALSSQVVVEKPKTAATSKPRPEWNKGTRLDSANPMQRVRAAPGNSGSDADSAADSYVASHHGHRPPPLLSRIAARPSRQIS